MATTLRLELPRLTEADITTAVEEGLAEAGATIVDELQAEPFNISRWAYKRLKRRPNRSPAQDDWTHRLDREGLVVENATTGRRRRGPYVGYIHYADTPRRPTVLQRVDRGEHLAIIEDAVMSRILDAWRRNG